MGLGANILPSLMGTYYKQISQWIPFSYLRFGPLTLISVIVGLIIWIRLECS